MKKGLILGSLGGFIIATILYLWMTKLVIDTSTPQYCASCHAMKIFYNTWENSLHGVSQKGAMKAKCVDCHLPHNNFLIYLITKFKHGVHDYIAHLKGKGNSPDYWLEKWKYSESTKYVYESGCKKCHKRLISSGIPLKAFTAHREYSLGLTHETCVSCHKNVGHGDLIATMKEKMEKLAKK